MDGRRTAVDVRVLEAGVMSLVVEGRQYRCVLDGDGVVIGGRRYGFEVDDPRSLQGRRGGGAGVDGPRAVKAPMPGRVVRVLVKDGQDVEEGEAIVVIEAMKMQNELRAPKAGRVVRVSVGVGMRLVRGMFWRWWSKDVPYGTLAGWLPSTDIRGVSGRLGGLLKRRAFMRLPQIFMSHQRLVWFLLVSRKSQRHSGLSQARTIGIASEVRRSEALRASSHRGVLLHPSLL